MSKPVVTFHQQQGAVPAPQPPPPVGLFSPEGAMFYALMPGDNAATIGAGDANLGRAEFPQLDFSWGPNPPQPQPGNRSFIVPDAGVYQVTYQVSITEPGQLQLFRGLAGATPVPESTASRATGTSLITNTVLLGLAADEILSVRNPSAIALTVTPSAGAGEPAATAATLTIVRVG